MTIRYRTRAVLMLPMLALACNDAPRSSDPSVARGDTEAARDVARIDADVRLDVALKRIAVLEREVAELKADPATVETDLLRQQLSTTQNALADASRESRGDDDALVSSPDGAGQRAAAKGEGGAIAPSPAARTNKAPTPRPKPQATTRSGTDPDMR